MKQIQLPHQATVLGLGAFGGNLAAARYLLQRGIRVKLTDRRPLSDFQSAAYQDVLDQCECYFGDHPESAFADSQMLVVTPAIRPDAQIVQTCADQGMTITSEIELFLSQCPAKVIAVTGTNGKSSTATLIHGILNGVQSENDGKSWLGGNIGHSLLPMLESMTEQDRVVVELSSFQLMQLRRIRFAADIAVLTNFSPNHLDWHLSLDEYRAAKQSLFDFQKPNHLAVLPEDDEGEWRVRARCWRHGIADLGEDGVFLTEGNVVVRIGDFEDAIRWGPPADWKSEHQQRNLAAALAVVQAIEGNVENALPAVASIQPLPHRMQVVADRGNVRFVNDSNSTTPESTIAGLQSVHRSIVLIAGGSDKGVDLSELAGVVSERCSAALLIGETADTLKELIDSHSERVPVLVVPTLSEAVARAVELASAGGMVLFSPGCASFGMFRDYRDRGDQFCQIVREVIGTQ